MISSLLVLASSVVISPAISAEGPICHPLDFSSYFRVERAKSNILLANADLKHANFNGHFLIVKNELIMETNWYIADCNTGKFLHEELEGPTADFKLSSNVLVLGKNKAPDEYELWSGSEWTKIENPDAVAAGNAVVSKSAVAIDASINKSAVAPTARPGESTTGKPSTISSSASPAGPSTILTQYQDLYGKHPATPTTLTCKKLDFSSFFRAQTSERNIRSLNADLAHPNFGGKYLLLKSESLFDTTWLIADCASGTFFHEFFDGNASFKPDSLLVIVNDTGKFPQLRTWQESTWIQIPDPVQNKHQVVKNTVYGENAKTLFKLLPNPDHRTVIHFEDLECKDDLCSVKSSDAHATSIPIEKDASHQVLQVLETYGTNLIQKARCSIEKTEPVCEIESSSM